MRAIYSFLIGLVLSCCTFQQGWSQLGNSLHSNCNQTLREGQGLISTPNYPLSYPSDSHCRWDIIVEDGRNVRLAFGLFDVESSLNCNYDKVTVYNGHTTAHPVLGRFCGAFLPGQLESTSNRMLVTFDSDTTTNNRGFYAWFASVTPTLADEDSCGGLLTDSAGSFHSPNYPKSNYPGSVTCSWQIRVPRGHYIVLSFEDFDVELSRGCKYDFVTIYGNDEGSDEATTLLGRLCGSMSNIPGRIHSSGNEMYVTFVSDTATSARGFQARYETKMAEVKAPPAPRLCGETVLLTGNYGEITSPQYGEGVPYANELTCTWRIVGRAGLNVKLRIDDFSLEKDETCRNDFLSIYSGSDSSGTEIGRFCGALHQTTLISDEMFIVFRTDSVGGEAGFRAIYTLQPAEDEVGGKLPEVARVVTTTTKPTATTTKTSTVATTTPPRPTFFQCPLRCPGKIKMKTRICSADFIAIVQITDIATLRSQSVVPVTIVNRFKPGSLTSEATTNLRIMCRRCTNISKKGSYLLIGSTVTQDGIELRPGDISVRYKQRKHTKVVKKLMKRCRVRRHPKRSGKKQRRGKGKKKRA